MSEPFGFNTESVDLPPANDSVREPFYNATPLVPVEGADIWAFASQVELSDWCCHLFGSDGRTGISWRPLKGKEPNRFWRWMQFICFGNRWVREAE